LESQNITQVQPKPQPTKPQDHFQVRLSVELSDNSPVQPPIQEPVHPPQPPARQQSINTMRKISPITSAYNNALIETTKVIAMDGLKAFVLFV
jgi:hypothetical protein